ncbi:MAG: tetratricopeptide repeat protein [Acidobacteriota bacterium]|nr:tetratricopeptide repeat protein [Acidobacteriota bacterium]
MSPSAVVQEHLRPYNMGDATRLLDLSSRQLRAWVRDGLLSCPEMRDPHFSFEDLVLLRAAKALMDARIAPRRVRATLGKLKAELPPDLRLSSLRFDAEGGRIVVGDGTCRWHADSGQTLFDFDADPADSRVVEEEQDCIQAGPAATDLWGSSPPESRDTAADRYARGVQREGARAAEARYAYRQALALEDEDFSSHVNLGRLLHEMGDLRGAERHYRRGLEIAPDDATAAHNLGVVLEDLGLESDALEAYEQAVRAEPDFDDPFHNAARLYEQRGDQARAVGLLKRLRDRTR